MYAIVLCASAKRYLININGSWNWLMIIQAHPYFVINKLEIVAIASIATVTIVFDI